jgi:anti-anti-sigma regulatory factor
MASNFRITTLRGQKSTEFRLEGDFDGTSAFELLHTMEDKCSGGGRVVVDTSQLRHVHPFGRDTFCNMLYLVKHLPIHLEFTGEKASWIAPERNRFF